MAGCVPALVQNAMAAKPSAPSDLRPLVMPPWRAVEAAARILSSDRLADALRYVADDVLRHDPLLRPSDLTQVLDVAQAVDPSGLPLRTRYGYLGVPADSKDATGLRMLACRPGTALPSAREVTADSAGAVTTGTRMRICSDRPEHRRHFASG